MTQARVEVITSVQRRRRWSAAEKERIVALALAPGAAVSAVARETGIHSSQLFRWRRQLCGPPRVAPGFAAVAVAPDLAALPTPTLPVTPGVIEIELATGARVRITGAADATVVSTAILALTGNARRGRG